MREDLAHWGQLGIGRNRLPPRDLRNRLDILGLRMGWGNGPGVLREYLGQDLGVVGHLITRGVWRMAYNWGLGELGIKESGEWSGGRERPGRERQIKERGNWLDG